MNRPLAILLAMAMFVLVKRRPAMPYKGTWIRHVCATIWAA